MRRLQLPSILLAFTLSTCASSAYAEAPTLAGTWSATAMRSDWNIGEWGKACGPAPNGGGAKAGVVTISSAGLELQLSGAGRAYSTDECWEQYPGLSRVSHSASARGWLSTCKTKPTDPRQATLVTTISATDTSIAFDETGQYQFIIGGQNCTASVRRTRTFLLLQRAGESAHVSAPSAQTATPQPCASPGPPARLEVRPSRKLIRAGESFEFHVAVTDESGCALGVTPTWRVLTENASLELSGPGKIHVPEDAPESTVELQATTFGHAVRVSVEIASRARYDALLAQKGLNSDGESTRPESERVATTAIGGSSVVTHDDSQRRRVLFVGVVGGAALLLGLLGFALVQHSRRKPMKPEARAPLRRASPALTPFGQPLFGKVCPTCREEYPPEAGFCPNDGNRLVPARGNVEPSGPSGGVCPICGQGYDPGVVSCPKHGEELLPAAAAAGVRESASRSTKKICPVCGKQYSGESQFCGGCGAALVPVN